MDETFYSFVESTNYTQEGKDSLIRKWKKFRETPIHGKCKKKLKTGKNVGSFCVKKAVGNTGYCSLHGKKMEPCFIIKEHPILKRLWNSTTCFVFDVDGVTVIGKTTKMESGSLCPLLPLDEKDILKCREIGYPYNLNRVKKIEKGDSTDGDITTEIKPRIKPGVNVSDIEFGISLRDN